jgi:hypothetical protein
MNTLTTTTGAPGVGQMFSPFLTAIPGSSSITFSGGLPPSTLPAPANSQQTLSQVALPNAGTITSLIGYAGVSALEGGFVQPTSPISLQLSIYTASTINATFTLRATLVSINSASPAIVVNNLFSFSSTGLSIAVVAGGYLMLVLSVTGGTTSSGTYGFYGSASLSLN